MPPETDRNALTNCSYLHEILFPCAFVRMPFTNRVIHTCVYIMAPFLHFEHPCSLLFIAPLILWDCAQLCDNLFSAAALFIQNLISDVSNILFRNCEICRVKTLPPTAQSTPKFK